MHDAITEILQKRTFAVVGASANPEKYGYKVWHMLREYGKTAYAINPNTAEIDGLPTYPTLSDLPETPEVVVAVVPPTATETLPAQLQATGIRYLWLQPGAESLKAVAEAESYGITVIHGGPCILVGLRTHFRL